jgi:hypothetical protein
MANRSLTSAAANLTFQATVQNLMADGIVAAAAAFDGSQKQKFANGDGNDQASRMWSRQKVTLAGSASVTYNLLNMTGVDIGAGAGNDALGQAWTIEDIAAILIKNENVEGAAGLLEIQATSGLPSNPWQGLGAHTVANDGALAGGGWLCKVQPTNDSEPITATNCNLRLDASGGAVVYSIYIIGRVLASESSSSAGN